jgi:hypothetical protein
MTIGLSDQARPVYRKRKETSEIGVLFNRQPWVNRSKEEGIFSVELCS